MSRPPYVVLVALSLAYLGAGCLKEQPKAQTAQTQGTTAAVEPIPQAPPTVADPTPVLTPNQELNTALQNFRRLKTFRAHLNMPEAKQPVSGTIEVTKPGRMRANVQIGDSSKVDIVIAGATAYVREDGGNWKDISNQPEGRKLSDMLYELTTGNNNFTTYGVRDSDKVIKTRDEGKKCDLYTTDIKAKDGTVTHVQVCASQGKVVYVKNQTKDQGPISFEYFDQDVLFLIERPI